MNLCLACGSKVAALDTICPTCGSPLTSAYLAKGTQLEQYTIDDFLGQGGFGITYRAHSSQKSVAIKEFFPEGSNRIQEMVLPSTTITVIEFDELKTKFLEEHKILKQFMRGKNHPNIVDVYAVFETNNTVYMVMELLEGETLEARIQKLGKLKTKEVRDIAQQLCDALEIVHAAGLLHRDIKPANVFLTGDGRAVLIDFGSARNFTAGRTMRHTRMVTPGYAPLEQYSSEARVTTATDVYALAATLYHALTGNAPPTAVDRMSGAKLIPLKANFSIGLREAIEHGLSLQVADRPKDAKAFAALALQRNTTTQQAPSKQKQSNPKQIPTTKPNFAVYNYDFLIFVAFGYLIFTISLTLKPIPWLQVINTGFTTVLTISMLTWLYTALLEFPLSLWHGLIKPISIVRRLLICTFAAGIDIVVVALVYGKTSSFNDTPLLIWFLLTTVFTYPLLLGAYLFPSRASHLQAHHFWDGFWLLMIAGLLQAVGLI